MESQHIIESYLSGENVTSISKRLHKDYRTVIKILGDLYVPKYTDTSIYKHGKLYLDESVFDILTEEACYWLGFLMADGCLYDGNQVSLLIGQRDENHLLKFQDFLKSKHKINYNTNKKGVSTCQLRFRSKKIYERLKELGFEHRKTGREKASKALRDSPHFWRGVIDGDGSISVSGQYQDRIHLSSSHTLCEQFQDFAISQCGVSKRNAITPQPGVYHTAYTGDEGRQIICALYLNCNIALERKRERALAIINNIEPRQRIVTRARSLSGMKFLREQALIGVAGDCSSFVRESYSVLGVPLPDLGRMGCSGLGPRTLLDRMEAIGLIYVEVPQPGTIVVWEYSKTPHHLGIVTEVFDNYFNVIHLSNSMGCVKEHPCTAQWKNKLCCFMEHPILRQWHTSERQEQEQQNEPEAHLIKKSQDQSTKRNKSRLEITSTTNVNSQNSPTEKQSSMMPLPRIGSLSVEKKNEEKFTLPRI